MSYNLDMSGFSETRHLNRRNFLNSILSFACQTAVASAGLYVVGSAFKDLDGSFVAGAKTCECLCARTSGFCGYFGTNEMYDSCFVMTASCASPPECSGNRLVNGGSCIPYE